MLRARRGWRASLLGGAVRDLVIGRQPHDLDFVLEGVESKDALHVWATLLTEGAHHVSVTMPSAPVRVGTTRRSDPCWRAA